MIFFVEELLLSNAPKDTQTGLYCIVKTIPIDIIVLLMDMFSKDTNPREILIEQVEIM